MRTQISRFTSYQTKCCSGRYQQQVHMISVPQGNEQGLYLCKSLLSYGIVLLLSCLMLCGIFTGCGNDQKARSARRVAYVSILPHAYFAQRIGGEHFDIETLIGTGQNPHNYSPTPGQMARLSDADLFFRAGVEFEGAMIPKIKRMAPELKIVDLRQGIEMREFDHGHDHAHEHGTAGEHDHNHDTTDYHTDGNHIEEGKDPHIWLSPPLAKKQAQIIRDAFISANPSSKDIYTNEYDTLASELDSLDAFLEETLKSLEGSELFVFHPSFGYFADRYGMEQIAVEIGGKEPSARALTRLVDKAKKRGARVIFVQPQFSDKSAKAIAAQINGTVVSINPLPENYIQEMRSIGLVVKDAIID
ncbi:MAG: metal ABC transporter solute-binding protein, Zn/Mn family [Chitinivibrionales bacterium]